MEPRLIASTFVALSLALFASNARADAESDAKDLFERGRQLRSAGDCAGAVPLFHKAYDIFPNALGTLRNAAECEESTGRWASARRTWLELKRAMILAHDPKYAGWDADATAAAQRLASRVAHLTVDVSTGGHDGDALEVTVNGEALQRTLVGTTLDRDPGKYVVRARIGAGEPAEQAVDLVTGESRTVRLVVAPPGNPLPPQPKPEEPAHGGSALIPIGAVTLSLGVAAFAGMGIAIGVRQDALSTLSSQCDYQKTTCSPALKPTVDRGNAASTAATVLAIGGGLAVGAGALMIVLGAVGSREEHPREKNVAFHVSPFGATLDGRF